MVGNAASNCCTGATRCLGVATSGLNGPSPIPCSQACPHEPVEARRATCPSDELLVPGHGQPAISGAVHQLDLQHEVRALLLLDEPEQARRLDERGDLRALGFARADRESES